MLKVGAARQGAELVEFEAALADAAKDLPDAVNHAPELADEVISRARSAAARLGSPQAERAAATLERPAGEDLSVRLENTDDVPYAVGAEWGAQHDVDRPTSRGTVAGWNMLPEPTQDGYFLRPAAGAVLDDDDALGRLLGPAVYEVLHRAFPD